jgi:hypothetical protein
VVVFFVEVLVVFPFGFFVVVNATGASAAAPAPAARPLIPDRPPPPFEPFLALLSEPPPPL